MDINNIEPQQSFLCFAFHFHFLKEVTVTCNSYLSVASAASTVTLSSVASRYGRPRSKYLMSRSTKGKISCRKLTSQQPVLGEKKRCYLKEQQHGKQHRRQSQTCSDYLVLDRFPEHPGHFIACTQDSATNVSKPAGLIAG